MTKTIAILIAAFFAVTAMAANTASTAKKSEALNQAIANRKVEVQKSKKKKKTKKHHKKSSKKAAATPAS